MLKLAWLGPPLAKLNGEQIHFETRKIISLFAYLSLNPKGNQREKLAALLWPEFDQAHAFANLRRALGSLNQSLQINCIESNRASVEFNEDIPVEIDILEFQSRIKFVRTHVHEYTENCPVCLKQLEEAVGLYRGEFLEGLNLPDSPDFDEWQYFLREELNHDYVWVLQRMVENYQNNGDWEKAASAARSWVRLDRIDENAQITLVDIYTRSNQPNLALRQVEEYSRLLKEELGQELDEETRERFQKVLQQVKSSGPKSPLVRQDHRQRIRTLLKTKLYLPRLKSNMVFRSRLISRLEEIPKYKLTLISAPAGFGKTSVLAEWAARSESIVGWLSLDSGDNDPACFFAYLCTAFDDMIEDGVRNAQSMLETFQPLQTLSLIAVLLNDLAKVSDPLVLILDDYQFITSKAIHEAVTYLLDHAGLNLHLVISSRADPPIQVARLRSQGELLEIRTDDLRFSLEEAAVFFNQTMKLDITTEDIQALAERTEGWAVGLQMAAISLQGSPDRIKFIHTFSGSHRYILDYLIQEVLDRQPEHVRDFLMKTSILEQFCGELCAYVVGETTEPVFQTIDYLDRSNLFLVPLDEERRWYRYHHLFADLLKTQLQHYHSQLVSELHCRASLWYEKEGLIGTSIEHAIASKDIERFSYLVEKDAQQLIYRIEFSRIQKWIDQLPREIVLKKAWIAITQGWVMLARGQIHQLEDWISQFSHLAKTLWLESYTEDEQNDIAANIASLQAYISFFGGNLHQSIELTNQALGLISQHNDVLRVRLLVQIGESCLVVHQLTDAINYFYQALDIGIHIQDFQSTTTATMRMYRSLTFLGRLNEAEILINRILKALSDAGRLNTPIAGKPELCWGDLLRERGQMEAAEIQLNQGLLHARQYNIPYDVITAIVYKVRWFYTQRRWDDAWNLLDEALPILNTSAVPPIITQGWAVWRAAVALEKGDFPEVEKFFQSQQMDWEDVSVFPKEEEYVLMARYLLRQGKLAETRHLLENLRKTSEEKGRNGHLVPIYLLSAVASLEQGQMESAITQMKKCIEIGYPEGYLAVFLNGGAHVEELLEMLQKKEIARPIAEYVDTLVQVVQKLKH